MTHLKDPSRQLTNQTINDSFLLMQDVFKEVGPYILERAGKDSYTDKHDGSPVTNTDREVERIIQTRLAERFPNLPVFGEESGYDDNQLPDACWLVDPIDGTKSFVQNIPAFTSMAVLIQDKTAVAAIIYNPSTRDMFTAQKGKGAYKNTTRINLQTAPLPPTALCKENFISEFNTMLQPAGVTCQKAPAGGGFGFTTVIEGKTAARFQVWGGGYTHDYAPGALLITEAGGVILPILEDVYTFQSCSFVACHPGLAPVVRPHLAQLRALELEKGK